MSLLIVGTNETMRQEEALKIAKEKFQSTDFDLHVYPKEKGENISIQESKEAKRKAILKPFNSTNKTFIFLELNQASLEAQNALLKLIEEPPRDTEVIITSPSQYLLPIPIVSRCFILNLGSKLNENFLTKEVPACENLLFILAANVNSRLVKAQELSKDKAAAVFYLKQTILEARFTLLAKIKTAKPPLPENKILQSLTLARLLTIITKLQKGLSALENTNTNQRLLLENLLLEFKVR